MREASGRYVALDGKLWKTLAGLLLRPGFLTLEYLDGRRRRYIGPARLFLVASLVLFAVLRFASESMEVADAFRAEAPERHANRGDAAEPVALDDEFNIDLRALPEANPLRKRTDRFNRLGRTQKVEQVVAGLLRYGPYAMFVLLPAFALLLKIAYALRSRRYPRRPRLYGEHLVFAAHSHAFLFVALALLFAIPWVLARAAVGAWILVYLLRSVRTVYGGPWLGIAARGLVLLSVYVMLLGCMTAALLIAAVLLV